MVSLVLYFNMLLRNLSPIHVIFVYLSTINVYFLVYLSILVLICLVLYSEIYYWIYFCQISWKLVIKWNLDLFFSRLIKHNNIKIQWKKSAQKSISFRICLKTLNLKIWGLKSYYHFITRKYEREWELGVKFKIRYNLTPKSHIDVVLNPILRVFTVNHILDIVDSKKNFRSTIDKYIWIRHLDYTITSFIAHVSKFGGRNCERVFCEIISLLNNYRGNYLAIDYRKESEYQEAQNNLHKFISIIIFE